MKKSLPILVACLVLSTAVTATGCAKKEAKQAGTYCAYHDSYHEKGDECDYMQYTPFTMTDENGTVWKLFIESNYDFILRAYTKEDGHSVVKQVVGPSFNPVENEHGSITLGVAAATVLVDDEEDEARTTKLNEGYDAFKEKYTAEHDQAMAHIPVGINTVAMTIYDPDVLLEDILPGWGK